MATGRALQALCAVLSLVALRLLQTKPYARAFPEQRVRPGQFAPELAKELELDWAIYSRPEPWVRDLLALIAGRLIYQGSKLFLSHPGPNTTLWEQCGGQGPVDVQTHCQRLLELTQSGLEQIAWSKRKAD